MKAKSEQLRNTTRGFSNLFNGSTTDSETEKEDQFFIFHQQNVSNGEMFDTAVDQSLQQSRSSSIFLTPVQSKTDIFFDAEEWYWVLLRFQWTLYCK